MTDLLRAAVIKAISALPAEYLTADMLARLESVGIKTYEHFLRVLDGAVRDLYNSKMGEAEFVDKLAGLLEQQMRRAWNEGMRDNGLDPDKDMLPEWEQVYQDLVAEQFGYVDQYAADIVEAAQNGASIDGLRARAEMWANNYTSTVNTARIVTAAEDDHFIWKLGATEKHCETCGALAGVVARAKDWEELFSQGIEPQGDKLMCGGWQCDCEVIITDEPLTKGGIPAVEHK
jgi:hypothetical protein